MQRCLAALGLLALSGGFAVPPAQATEGGVSLYVPGLRSTLGGVVQMPASNNASDTGRVYSSVPMRRPVIALSLEDVW
jgi:hypothetical protein